MFGQKKSKFRKCLEENGIKLELSKIEIHQNNTTKCVWVPALFNQFDNFKTYGGVCLIPKLVDIMNFNMSKNNLKYNKYSAFGENSNNHKISDNNNDGNGNGSENKNESRSDSVNQNNEKFQNKCGPRLEEIVNCNNIILRYKF